MPRTKTKKIKQEKNKKIKNAYKDPVAELKKSDISQFSKIYENKNVKEILLKHFEEECINIMPELNDYIRDEVISNKKNIKSPIIRKWLNLMHNKGIVEFTKKKDKKTGWFTYYWKIRPNKVIEFVVSEINREIEELEKKRKEIKAHNFACDCKTWTFTEALESDFVCPECEKVIMEKENNALIAEVENKKKLLEEKKENVLSLS